MNHSINNLLWITLFAVLYISSVNGQYCQIAGHFSACFDCLSVVTCEATNPGTDGCGCLWTWTNPTSTGDLTDGTCGIITCDPTTDPTIDPTVDPTVDPTIDPTQMPTTPTSNPSQAPTEPSQFPTETSRAPTEPYQPSQAPYAMTSEPSQAPTDVEQLIEYIVLNGNFTKFLQYVANNNLTVENGALNALEQLFLTSNNQEKINQAIIRILDVRSGSIIITYGITGSQSVINEVENTINNAITYATPITLGSLILTVDMSGLTFESLAPTTIPLKAPTKMPSEAPTIDDDSDDNDYSDDSDDNDDNSSETFRAENILGLTDENNIKNYNYNIEYIFKLSNDTTINVWGIIFVVIILFIILACCFYCEKKGHASFKNDINEINEIL